MRSSTLAQRSSRNGEGGHVCVREVQVGQGEGFRDGGGRLKGDQ